MAISIVVVIVVVVFVIMVVVEVARLKGEMERLWLNTVWGWLGDPL